jgi:hypothetical protein
MHYKTIVLELLQQYPRLHRNLQSRRTLLQALDHYASTLQDRHDHWTHILGQKHPGRAPAQLSSQALELALQDLRDSLPSESAPNADTPEEWCLDAAMAFLRHHTPPA